MSLTDELLADLETAAGDDIEDQIQSELAGNEGIEEAMEEDEMEEDADEEEQKTVYDRVTRVARLRGGARYERIMNQISEIEDSNSTGAITGPVEADPVYRLIVECNALAVDIDNEIGVVHKFVKDKYGKRFPELESTVPSAIEYIRCVKELGNDILAKAKNNETLQAILPPATVIVVSVSASSTSGEPLSVAEIDVINEACDLGLELHTARLRIITFVESRMAYIAPNLSALCGATTAARMMSAAGGLDMLANMPACNIQNIGAQKRTLSGFSTTAVLPHTGFMYYTPHVQGLPEEFRKKAAKILANKCSLAVRVDASHSAPDGSAGVKLSQEVQQKFDKLLEPAAVKAVKPLPKPIDEASKKRGGRRARKMKERLGMTEMRRQANRMNFGELEEDVLQDEIGFSLGQLKSSRAGAGKLRAAQVDDKTRARMSKALQKQMAQKRHQGLASTVATQGGATSVRRQSSATAGTASTVTFTPVQGLEIANPTAKPGGTDGTKSTYFSSATGFAKI